MADDANYIEDLCASQKEKRRQKSWWKWVIVFSAFVINIIIDGCMFSFGIIFVSLLDYFNKSKAFTVLSGSILDSAPMLCGPFASMMTNRFGYRKATIIGGLIAFSGFFASAFVNSIELICVTFGCIVGLGFSIPYLNSVVVVTSYFESKNTIAIGISQSGAGLGALIFAPLYEYLIEIYGWRGAVMIISGIVLQTLPCGAMFKDVDRSVEDAEETEEATKSSKLQVYVVDGEYLNTSSDKVKDDVLKADCQRITVMLKNKRFLLFMLAQFTVYFWYDTPYNFTVSRMQDYGIDKRKGSYIIAVIGACHIIGNICFGFLGNKTKEFRYHLYYISLFLWGINVSIIPLFTDYVSNIILGGCFGVISACQEAIHATIVIDILGPDEMTDAYGILLFVEGLANLSGPPIAGTLQFLYIPSYTLFVKIVV